MGDDLRTPVRPDAPRRRGPGARAAAALFALALLLLFCALGVWQLQRRAWKLELIRQVEARAHAAPAPAPGPEVWPRVSAARDAYRRVRVTGVLLDGAEARVHALTDLGSGAWILTPLRTDRGFTVLVDRGFVPADRADPRTRAQGRRPGPVTVTGLLRVTEPGGSFAARNDPAHDEWWSRDVEAIARSRRLGPVAPYFIDADATPNPGGLPVGGLTVIAFPNSHLVYAVTWFSLAALVAVAAAVAVRQERRARR